MILNKSLRVIDQFYYLKWQGLSKNGIDFYQGDSMIIRNKTTFLNHHISFKVEVLKAAWLESNVFDRRHWFL